jgi:hypothetical protein
MMSLFPHSHNFVQFQYTSRRRKRASPQGNGAWEGRRYMLQECRCSSLTFISHNQLQAIKQSTTKHVKPISKHYILLLTSTNERCSSDLSSSSSSHLSHLQQLYPHPRPKHKFKQMQMQRVIISATVVVR